MQDASCIFNFFRKVINVFSTIMNKKRFTVFADYLEGFTQRIVHRYPDAVQFIEEEKVNMIERFPELVKRNIQEPQRNQYDAVKEKLESSLKCELSQRFFFAKT